MHMLVLFLIMDTKVKMGRMEKNKTRKYSSTTNSYAERQEKYWRTKNGMLGLRHISGRSYKSTGFGVIVSLHDER